MTDERLPGLRANVAGDDVANERCPIDPFQVRQAADVHDLYQRLRDEQPVCPVAHKPMALVTRYDDLIEVLRDTELYSSRPDDARENLVAVGFSSTHPRVAEIYASAHPIADTLVRCDPPTHSRQRRVLARFFTPKAVASDWAPIIKRNVRSLMDEVRVGESFDIMGSVAVPLPIRVISEILGVPPEKAADFKRWSDAYVASLGRQLTADEEIEKASAHVEMQAFFMSEIVERQDKEVRDLLGELARVATASTLEEADAEGSLTLPEAVDIAEQILVAGNETTTQALGEAALQLAMNPEQLDLARDDLSLRANLIEELLRLTAPILGLFRYATDDHERQGTSIHKNDVVAALYGSANRDARVFDNPEQLRADRENAKKHVAFGIGIHFCLGAHLARAEIRAFVDELVDRGLRIDASETVGADEGTFLIRGRRHQSLRFVKV